MIRIDLTPGVLWIVVLSNGSWFRGCLGRLGVGRVGTQIVSDLKGSTGISGPGTGRLTRNQETGGQDTRKQSRLPFGDHKSSLV